MKSQTTRIFFWLAAAVFLGAIIINSSFSQLDPDLGWHLKTGQDILAAHHLPAGQIYLHTLAGKSWVDHEWLINIAMYLLYQQGGYSWLVLAYAAIIMAALWLSIAAPLAQYRGRADAIILAWLFFCVMAMRNFVGPRPQMLGWLMLIILFALLKSWQADRRLGRLIVLPAFFWLWACLHASFLIGLSILALYLFFESLLPCLRRRQSWSEARWPLLLGLGSLAATWLTPYDYKLYGFLLSYGNSAYLNIISEWRALYLPPLQYWNLLFIGISCGLLATSFLLAANRRRLRLVDALALLLFLVMAISSIRHFALFYAAASFIILPFFLDSQLTSEQPSTFRWHWLLPAVAMFLGALLILIQTEYVRDPFAYYCRQYPCAAVAYIKEHPSLLNLKWFNNYNFGGYLIWTLPQARLYIDGRMPQSKYQDNSLLENYMALYNSPRVLDLLDKANISFIFWKKTSTSSQPSLMDRLMLLKPASSKAKISFDQAINNSPKWRLIYQDDASLLWQKR